MLTKLELRGCRNCWVLPSLGQLLSLMKLKLYLFDMLKMIGGEFYKGNETHHHQETPFRSLKSLSFYNISCWEEWELFECDDDAPFPQLGYRTVLC
ncbi:Putative disease resistance protein [Arachis hypogaea]|nr:Putative disease resistance protein [Arachis hypogaea]